MEGLEDEDLAWWPMASYFGISEPLPVLQSYPEAGPESIPLCDQDKVQAKKKQRDLVKAKAEDEPMPLCDRDNVQAQKKQRHLGKAEEEDEHDFSKRGAKKRSVISPALTQAKGSEAGASSGDQAHQELKEEQGQGASSQLEGLQDQGQSASSQMAAPAHRGRSSPFTQQQKSYIEDLHKKDYSMSFVALSLLLKEWCQTGIASGNLGPL